MLKLYNNFLLLILIFNAKHEMSITDILELTPC